MTYSLKQLRYFVAAGEALSVTRAAEKVNVSQPSISAALAHLESVFNVQLFIRHHAQGLSLTPAGRRLMVEVKRLLNQAEALSDYAASLGDSLAGTVEVGCFLTIAPIVMPALIREFAGHRPAITVQCVEADHEGLLDGLRQGRIEIALSYDLNVGSGFSFAAVAALPPYVILAPEHPLAQRRAVSLHELHEEPMVLLDLPYSRDYFFSIFLSLGMEPNIAHRSASPDMVRSLVANGFGYSLLNARVENDRSPDGKTYCALPLVDNLPPLKLGLITPTDVTLTRSAEAFVQFCQDQWHYPKLAARPPQT